MMIVGHSHVVYYGTLLFFWLTTITARQYCCHGYSWFPTRVATRYHVQPIVGGGGGGTAATVAACRYCLSSRLPSSPSSQRTLAVCLWPVMCPTRLDGRRRMILSSSMLSSMEDTDQNNNHQYNKDNDIVEDPFPSACSALGLTTAQQDDLLKALVTTGLVQQYYNEKEEGSDDNSSSNKSNSCIIINSHLLLTISRDYFESSQPMVFTKTLQDDFALSPLHAHICRSVAWYILKQQQQQQHDIQEETDKVVKDHNESITTFSSVQTIVSPTLSINGLTTTGPTMVTNGRNPHRTDNDGDESISQVDDYTSNNNNKPKRPLYKQVILDTKTQQRKARYSSLSSLNNNNLNSTTTATTATTMMMIPQKDYGLHRDLSIVQQTHPILACELHDYYIYMTQPNTLQQEHDPPLRTATADVYMRHARLFLGWYTRTQHRGNHDSVGTISKDNECSSSSSSSSNKLSVAADMNGSSSNSSSNNNNSTMFSRDLSLDIIFPTPQKESVTALLDFMIWLRRERNIAVSYEANLWRGLIKLLKFRFRHHDETSSSSSASGSSSKDGSGETVPAIRQARSWHRRAHQQANKAPKQSNEDAKWLSWPQYLGVVQQMAKELQEMLTEYYYQQEHSGVAEVQKDIPSKPRPVTKKAQKQSNKSNNGGTDDGTDRKNDQQVYSVQQRKIATFYQKYLILAIFATVPDRQRTIRELEIGKSLVRVTTTSTSTNDNNEYTNNNNYDDENSNKRHQEVWCIKHAPDEYKTGGTYGERPPMYLTEVSKDIDVFLSDWRPCLCAPHHHQQQQSSSKQQQEQQHNFLFVQPRTGNPLTSDSVYQIVARQCYTYTGQRTNPHLLRDMIVTHVRESQHGVTEPQLEALALFMGHSVAVQRASYDRRTLTKKVAPAVNLIQQVNTQAQNNNNININNNNKRK